MNIKIPFQQHLLVFCIAWGWICGINSLYGNEVDLTNLTPQMMQNPIEINPKGITILLAADAMRSPEIVCLNSASKLGAKRFFLKQIQAGKKVAWNVAAPEAGVYSPTLLILAKKGQKIALEGPQNTITVTSDGDAWQRLEASEGLKLPQGKSVISLRVEQGEIRSLKAIELINVAEAEAVAKRIKAFKGDASWMSDAGYGIMVQAGGWDYPPTGPKMPWPGFAEKFNVTAFVDKVQEMGGSYIVWSTTWVDYLFPAPIQSIAELLPNRVSNRDLLGDLLAECSKRKMKVLFYYHLGHDHEDVLLAKGWKAAGGNGNYQQDYPARQKWLGNEEKIFTEIGKRYGDGLAGWFIDDGVVWYPADFEKLGAALKAGNPKRVICYNTGTTGGASVTPFQDFHSGEGFSGEKKNRFAVDANGFSTDSVNKGLKLWGCFLFEPGNWGIARPNYKIGTTSWTVDRVVSLNQMLLEKKFSVAINLLMYEDGTFSEKSYSVLKEAAQRLKRGKWAKAD